ncbi:unnamed protein product [Gongylonema pulchrum]|uniref:Signal peptidase I n=1 Tax=Gongylonema pulchrum TaxID=637853 RepID=A0A183F0T3_9BILA|nr:unnamed protein product [Gongylonema pulchrum]
MEEANIHNGVALRDIKYGDEIVMCITKDPLTLAPTPVLDSDSMIPGGEQDQMKLVRLEAKGEE